VGSGRIATAAGVDAADTARPGPTERGRIA